mmetsp:Transcript_4068/g.25552  ORF Transcript_4068/g.25552 Transcript_4068/m.25552 type:complete len:84 (-) Transcript_4068:1263-1514(-)
MISLLRGDERFNPENRERDGQPGKLVRDNVKTNTCVCKHRFARRNSTPFTGMSGKAGGLQGSKDPVSDDYTYPCDIYRATSGS